MLMFTWHQPPCGHRQCLSEAKKTLWYCLRSGKPLRVEFGVYGLIKYSCKVIKRFCFTFSTMLAYSYTARRLRDCTCIEKERKGSIFSSQIFGNCYYSPNIVLVVSIIHHHLKFSSLWDSCDFISHNFPTGKMPHQLNPPVTQRWGNRSPSNSETARWGHQPCHPWPCSSDLWVLRWESGVGTLH